MSGEAHGPELTPTTRPSLRRSSAYSTSFIVVRLGVSLAALPVLTHTLGLERYGVWAVLVSVLTLTSALQFGLAPALSFHLAKAAGDVEEQSEILGTSLVLFAGLGLFVAAVLVGGSKPIAGALFHGASRRRDAEPALIFFGAAAFLQYLKQWLLAAEAGLQRFDLQAWAEGLGTIALYGGLAVVSLAGFGVPALAGWLVIATVGTLGAHWYLWRSRVKLTIRTRGRWRAARARELFSFGTRQWASQLGSILFGQADRILVNIAVGPAAAGLYSAATAVAGRINELSAAPLQVIVPAIAESRAAGDEARVGQIYERARTLNMLMAYGLASVVMVGAEPLAALLVPSRVGTMTTLLRILGLAYGLYSLNAVGYFAAQGVGRPSINARWVPLTGVLFLAMLWAAVERYGVTGAAWANLTYGLTLGVNYEVSRLIGLGGRHFFASHGSYLVALAGCFLAASYVVTAGSPSVRIALGAATLAVIAMGLRRAALSAQIWPTAPPRLLRRAQPKPPL